jgi:predicted PhzF superfamily epimerase YddE/YHI9
MSDTKRVPLYIVDAFTDRAFSGNPAAVCLLESWPADAWLARVAAEMNLSETAFLVPRGKQFLLRWLTPTVEVDLCGHATLASAFVLWHAGRAPLEQPIEFSTRSGTLTATRRGTAIELDFPVKPARESPPPPGLVDSLGVRATYTGQSDFDWLVEVETDDAVRAMKPDFVRLAGVDCRGVIVTARATGGEFDFVSRFFAPASGLNEDPVTGSAHATLADHWHRRLGKSQFHAYQASPRGGKIDVTLRGNRVLLGGTAVLVVSGELAPAACNAR